MYKQDPVIGETLGSEIGYMLRALCKQQWLFFSFNLLKESLPLTWGSNSPP